MGKKLVRKVLEMLKKLASSKTVNPMAESSSEEAEEVEDLVEKNSPQHPYIKFWEQFAKSIKMGVIEDRGNRAKLAKLLRFKTSTSEGKWVSLDEYVSNMKPWQTDIYYIAGENEDSVKKSPFMELAKKKDVEVLYLTDPIDEYVFQSLTEFEKHKILSLSKGDLKFGDEDEALTKKRAKVYKERFSPLTKFMKELFTGKVGKVTVSERVASSPAVMVTGQYGYTANMERIMRAQTMGGGEKAGNRMGAMGRTLELNPRHPIISQLNQLVQSAPEDQKTKDLAALVFDTALLASGFLQDETDTFAERMYRVIGSELNVKSFDLEKEIEVPEEEEEAEEEPSFGGDNDDEDRDEL